jgi:hypothetical protein
MLFAELTVLFQFKTIFQGLLVLTTVIVDAFAFSTLKFDEIILRHSVFLNGQTITR